MNEQIVNKWINKQKTNLMDKKNEKTNRKMKNQITRWLLKTAPTCCILVKMICLC